MSPEANELALYLDNDDYAVLSIIVVMRSRQICGAEAKKDPS